LAVQPPALLVLLAQQGRQRLALAGLQQAFSGRGRALPGRAFPAPVR
jgi:hypothetical protein